MEHYHPNLEQVAFADAVRRSLLSMLPLARLHQSHEESAQTWQALNDLGVLAIAVPEEQGGSGLGAVEEALIAYELGRCLVASSVLSTMAATHVRPAAIHVHAPAKQRVAAAYRRGDLVICVDDAG